MVLKGPGEERVFWGAAAKARPGTCLGTAAPALCLHSPRTQQAGWLCVTQRSLEPQGLGSATLLPAVVFRGTDCRRPLLPSALASSTTLHSLQHTLCCDGHEITSRSFLITVNSRRAAVAFIDAHAEQLGLPEGARGLPSRGRASLLILANWY